MLNYNEIRHTFHHYYEVLDGIILSSPIPSPPLRQNAPSERLHLSPSFFSILRLLHCSHSASFLLHFPFPLSRLAKARHHVLLASSASSSVVIFTSFLTLLFLCFLFPLFDRLWFALLFVRNRQFGCRHNAWFTRRQLFINQLFLPAFYLRDFGDLRGLSPGTARQ